MSNKGWLIGAAGLVIVLAAGLFLSLMDVDASQYGSISLEMLQNGSWLEVMHRRQDYLDKPPLLFWSAAGAFSIFGVSTWAYKLPSVLVALFGVWCTYRFTLLYYAPKVARMSAGILATSTAFLLLCNDVRTDTLLLGFSAASVWQYAVFIEKRSWPALFWGGAFTAGAMLAKGPVGAILPVAALGSHLLLRRDWASIFQWKWLLALLPIALLLIPMCWGLYHQFDLHPEKTVNDRTGVSGLYFYFWEQSFGRITGENVWKDDSSPFYFLHIYTWAFLPWTLLFLFSLVLHFRQIYRLKWRLGAPVQEGFSLGGFGLMFLALSMSRYKLPHYIFITLPWASIITAVWLEQLAGWKWVRVVQWVVGFLVTTVASLLVFWIFPGSGFLVPGIFIVLAAWVGWRLWPSGGNLRKLYGGSIGLAILIGFTLNFHFYPQLLPYQSTSEAGRWFRDHHIPPEKTAQMGRSGHALEFYAGHYIPHYDEIAELEAHLRKEGKVWLYVRQGGREQLDRAGIPYQVVASFRHFQVARLHFRFILPDSRAETLIPAEVVVVGN